jgi:Excreted virulence factor EspC, type VII ESX diderm
MSGDDLRVTTAHLVELAVEEARAASETRSATFVKGADAALRSTHGIIASVTASAVEDAVSARRNAGKKVAAISDDLGGRLSEAARRYDQIDDAMGGALDGQVRTG